ncbi:MAG: hypothetical protein LBT00_04450 [Spirochaetaceae bacterium]|nr:hypothetical protein [Spirochaetaceae bacterium]
MVHGDWKKMATERAVSITRHSPCLMLLSIRATRATLCHCERSEAI